MKSKFAIALVSLISAAALAQAQPWTSFDDNTRYMALGDSITAGYGAIPATQGFVYQLYQSGAIDNLNNLLLVNAGVPNATSNDVKLYQVPQVQLFFSNTGKSYKKVVTLAVGGNDLLGGAGALGPFTANLGVILTTLILQTPDVKIYVGNFYDPRLPVPGLSQLVDAANIIIATVAANFPNNVVVVDLHAAFDGRSGLLLGEKKNAGFGQVHPTNAGYRVIADAFADTIRSN